MSEGEIVRGRGREEGVERGERREERDRHTHTQTNTHTHRARERARQRRERERRQDTWGLKVSGERERERETEGERERERESSQYYTSRGTWGLKVSREGADIEESIVREHISKSDAHILERLYELQASLDILGALCTLVLKSDILVPTVRYFSTTSSMSTIYGFIYV